MDNLKVLDRRSPTHGDKNPSYNNNIDQLKLITLILLILPPDVLGGFSVITLCWAVFWGVCSDMTDMCMAQALHTNMLLGYLDSAGCI